MRLRGGGDVEIPGGGEDDARMWMERNELRCELMSVLEESAERMCLYEEMVDGATNVTACMMTRDMLQAEHECFARHVRQLRELLERWSDESM